MAQVPVRKDAPMTELEWASLLKEIDATSTESQETAWQRLKRKFKAEPMIPLGTIATIGCLFYGLKSMAQNKTQQSQYAMRGRVGAQAFTILAVAYGMLYSSTAEKDIKKRDRD